MLLNFSFLIKNCGCVGKCFKCYFNIIKRKIAVTVRCKMCFLFLDQTDKCLGLQHSQHVICSHLLALLFLVFFFARYLYKKFFSIVKLCCFNLRQVWFHHWSVLPCRFLILCVVTYFSNSHTCKVLV